MRNITLVLFLLIGTLTAYSQDKALRDKLVNNWKKTDITAIDGSPYYDEETLNLDLDFNIISKDSLYMFNSNRLSKVKYLLRPDSVLVISGIHLKIREVSDIKLVLESFESQGYDFRITYTPKRFFDLTYTPEAYRSKNGDVVFISIPGKLEPQFINNDRGPMDYIFDQFGYPEFRKGGFVVRFVVTKKGDLAGVHVVASSNDRYNSKLVNAVLKTKGKWLPAIFKGEYVSSEVEYDYNLGFDDNRNLSTKTDSVSQSTRFYDNGISALSRGSYKDAANSFKMATSYNPLNIDAYYKHAEVSLALRRKDDACESLRYLLLLEQKKAISLYEKNCK